MAISIIFPAFVSEYKGTEDQSVSGFVNNFSHRLDEASHLLKMDLTGFDFRKNTFLQDELKSQYISYIFSCTVADILNDHNVKTSFVSGYSMGIYAALYYCRSVNFSSGLMLVKHAWEKICTLTEGSTYGMGMIIGLTETDVSNLFQQAEDIEICNQNNPYTFIISGSKNTVERILIAAQAEGALRATPLSVSKPYHSKFLKNAGHAFAEAIKDIPIMTPAYPYISAMDQKEINTADAIRNEVTVNLPNRMNWYKTMDSLLMRGTDILFECGAGDGLTRNARFIEGSFQSFSTDKIEDFLDIVSNSFIG
ncbi:MAG: acyltransferase domain-containing protein [Bacteroidales bacterium]|nr:acyltransferase domain-containing protein [Bacteroidales bacterium]